MVDGEEAWLSEFVALGGRRADAEAIARRPRELPGDNVRRTSALQRIAAGPSKLAPPPSRSTNPRLTLRFSGTQPAAPLPSGQPRQREIPLIGPPAPAHVRPRRVRRGRPPAALNVKPPTQRELDLFQLALECEEGSSKKFSALGFMATAMIYASLPHSEVPGAIFKRRNGRVSLSILNDPEIGLPWGKIPRIIIAFLCTEAKRNKDTLGPVIHLGRSQAEFMRKLGLQSRGGKRGDIRRVREQSIRLFTSTITLTGQPNGRFHWDKVSITDRGMLLWNPQQPDEKAPWQSTLRLSDLFFNECVSHSMPIQMWVLHQLRSPLAIDIYVWLTYRFNALEEPESISWRQLQWQFGANYALTPQGQANFKSNFKKALRQVLAIYRDAKVEVRPERLVLLPAKPHVPPLER